MNSAPGCARTLRDPTLNARAEENGAGGRVRTCDFNLGEVALYQLSYSRALHTT